MLFYTDENINYVNDVWAFWSPYHLAARRQNKWRELLHVQQAAQCNADAVAQESSFTATLLIIHGGHVREKLYR